jgi:acyl transferase domain-containing protein
MDGRGDRDESVAIIGMACRFPGARDPAEFHDLAVAGLDKFQPVAALPGRPLRAAMLDDWSAPQIADDPVTGGLWPDVGPVRKLAAEMTALALTDAGLRDVAGTCRTGLIIASSVPELGEQVREEFGFPACGLFSRSAHVSSLHAVAAAAEALQTGQLDLAVAGGAELGHDPVWLALLDRAGALGAGEMRVYAADPPGLLPGEGCGMVVLVRAADARTAGVPVYAEIAGWSTPPAGSERPGPVLLQAYQRAGVDPADVQLIEGQGIGTGAGDSAELAALAQLRRDGRDEGTVAALGAISACIG